MFKKYFLSDFTSLTIAALISATIFFLQKFLPPNLPLFYSLPWGEKQLATKQQLLILPASIALTALLNLTISWQLHEKQSFFKKALSLASIIVSIILTTTLIKIVLIFI
ncbi:hypothetical protein HY384_02495 [Candidatus Daviesbacteria bacterium]|nr:hypothetical protein [Candidatus Daviesbacteria bacterium]